MQWRATVEQCIAVEEEERSCGCGDSGKGIQQSTFLGFAKVQCNPEDLHLMVLLNLPFNLTVPRGFSSKTLLFVLGHNYVW